MAATVSAWSKPGAWALDAEENETELLQQRKEDDVSHGGETADFPSLSAAATTKPKKKKSQALSLKEFAAHGTGKTAAAQHKGLTADELFALPTGPRERTAEELDRNKLGGGFRSYGGGARDEQPRRQGSFNRDSNREPSRADETDDWGAGKKLSVNSGFDRRDRGERGGSLGDSQSRADEVDNWASNKSFVPSETRKYEKRGGFGSESSTGGSDSSNWGRRSGGAFDSLRERRGGLEDTESWGRKREEVSSGSRPKLNLQPRTLPVKEEEKSEIGNVVKAKGSDPFGDARPREEVLKGKGVDWKEIEEKLESVKIKEEVVSDGAKGSNFWSGSGSGREKPWRRPESADSHPQSAGETEKGDAESCEDGEGRDS
ncbi:hypothetical protein ACS0TY_001629 [Phlomoides rotata]